MQLSVASAAAAFMSAAEGFRGIAGANGEDTWGIADDDSVTVDEEPDVVVDAWLELFGDFDVFPDDVAEAEIDGAGRLLARESTVELFSLVYKPRNTSLM